MKLHIELSAKEVAVMRTIAGDFKGSKLYKEESKHHNFTVCENEDGSADLKLSIKEAAYCMLVGELGKFIIAITGLLQSIKTLFDNFVDKELFKELRTITTYEETHDGKKITKDYTPEVWEETVSKNGFKVNKTVTVIGPKK